MAARTTSQAPKQSRPKQSLMSRRIAPLAGTATRAPRVRKPGGKGEQRETESGTSNPSRQHKRSDLAYLGRIIGHENIDWAIDQTVLNFADRERIMGFRSTTTHLRKLFLQGIALLAPLIITIALLVWLGRSVELLMGGLLRGLMPDDWYLPGMGLLAGIGVTLAAGLLANLFLVRWLLTLAERILDRIPLVKILLQGLKDVARFFGQEGKRTLGRPVAVDIRGIQLVGFVMQERVRLPVLTTADSPSDSDTLSDAEPERIAVYLPMSYQVGGYTAYLRPEQVRDLDVGTDQALRAVITGGALTTPLQTPRKATKRK